MGFFRSVFAKLSAGLARTRDQLVGGLRSILAGRRLSEELLKEIRQRLIAADVGVRATEVLVAGLEEAWKKGQIEKGEDVLAYLKKQMAGLWPAEDRELKFADQGPTVILVCGVNGSGKTTSIAKLARAMQEQGRSVLLAACDTFRAAAVEQLEIWAQRLGVEVVKGRQGGDPAAVAFDAAQAAVSRGVDVLIVDTAGRLHTQEHLMRELGKIRNVLGKKIPGAPHEVLLVVDATTGQNAIQQARVFTAATAVTGIFLAKLDGTARGGIVVAIRQELGIPVKFVGVGERPEDIEPFDPERFVEAMFAE